MSPTEPPAAVIHPRKKKVDKLRQILTSHVGSTREAAWPALFLTIFCMILYAFLKVSAGPQR